MNIIASVNIAAVSSTTEILFPVPANTRLYSKGMTSDFYCYDATGREFVLPSNSSNGLTEYDVSRLCPGVYVLFFEVDGEVKRSSFIINR